MVEDAGTGGPRSEGVVRQMAGRGGPRVSLRRTCVSLGSGASAGSGDGSNAGWKPAAMACVPGAGPVASAASTVSTQLQAAGQAPTVSLTAASPPARRQFESRAASGPTQQQNKSNVPHVRPSHSQEANARGATVEQSSAQRTARQRMRERLTQVLLHRRALSTGRVCRGALPCRRSRRTTRRLRTGVRRLRVAPFVQVVENCGRVLIEPPQHSLRRHLRVLRAAMEGQSPRGCPRPTIAGPQRTG